MTLVGMYEADRGDYREDELHGQCDGATHVLSAAQVGAFSLYTGARTDTTASVGQSVDAQEVLNSDGVMAACAAATTADRAAPEGCGALVRLEFSPLLPARPPTLGERTAPTPAPPPDVAPVDPAPAPPPDVAAVVEPAWSTPARPTAIDPAIVDHARSEHSRSQWPPIDPGKLQHPWSAPPPPPPAPSLRHRRLYAAGGTMLVVRF